MKYEVFNGKPHTSYLIPHTSSLYEHWSFLRLLQSRSYRSPDHRQYHGDEYRSGAGLVRSFSQNPFKRNKGLLHEFDRYDMVERAIADNSRLKVTDIEFSMPRPSYTIDTLIRLQEKFPQHTFRLIIGGDNLAQFPNWKNYEQILEYFGLYVYPRPNSQPSPLEQHPNVRFVPAPLLDISATFIRECLKNGRSIRYLVPEVVEEMILRKKFYVV